MLLFASSPSFSSYASNSYSAKRCSLFVVLGVPVFAIILVNLISSATGAIDTNKQLAYYQTLQRHLNDFTVKDDAEDLLAMPSDSNGASVAVVAPPPEMSRKGPITQYAQRTKSSSKKEEHGKDKEGSHKYNKKPRGQRRHHRPQDADDQPDNEAQESSPAAVVAYAPPPASLTNRLLYNRNTAAGSDNVAEESYQSKSYAPPPDTSSSSASKKSYDQYWRRTNSAASTTTARDNQAQESLQSNSYAPPPAASARNYDQYPQSSSATDETGSTTKDNQAEESYLRRSYAPPPPSVLTPAGAPPPQPPSQSPASPSYYPQYHRSSITAGGSPSRANDNRAEESYQRPMSYAPPPPPPAAHPSPQTAPVSSVVNTNVKDSHAQESYPHASISYAPSPPASYSSSSLSTTAHYSPSSYSSSNTYQGSSSYPSSSYYPQSEPAPAPLSPSPQSSSPVTVYSPPYSPQSYGSPQAAPSSQHSYYAHPSPNIPYADQTQPGAPYPPGDLAAPIYAPYPATTPAPAVRAQYLSYYSSPKPTILQPASNNKVVASASASSPLLAHHPHLTSIDNFQQQQRDNQQTAYSSPASSHSPMSDYARETFEFSPAPPGPPPGPHPPPPPPPPSSYSPQNDQSIAEDSIKKQKKLLDGSIGSEVDLYRLAVTSPGQLVVQAFNFLKSLSIPQDHYINVVSFVGVYLFMAIMFYGQDDRFQQKCEGGEEHLYKIWHYHVGRRFVPAVHSVDEKLKKKFLKLFKGMHLHNENDDDDDGGSSEETNTAVNFVNEMCPRGAFFYSLAPMHLEARMQVQKILVAQPSPVHVYHAAKALLYKHKIHPKIWYLGLVAAALERPDMTGMFVPHPIDAIPDWFIPGDLILDEMEKYRSRSLERSLQKRRIRRDVDGNSTDSITLTTTSPAPETTTLLSSSLSTEQAHNLTSTSSSTTKFTRKPLLFTRRSTTTYRPPEYSYFSGESGSFENFVLDGTPNRLKDRNKYQNYAYDEESINDSVQKFQQINANNDGKYKPKKKPSKTSQQQSQDDEQSQQQSQQQEQDASTSASAEQEINLVDSSGTQDASGSTEADNNNSGGGDSGDKTSAQQNDAKPNNNDDMHDDELAVIAPAPPSVRPSHLSSAHHNAIKVGDLTVVVGSGPSLLNDVQIYNLQDDHKKGDDDDHKKKHGKKGHKKGKGKKGKGKDDDDHCIVVDGKVGRDNGIENRLWYFREDIMVSQNHWYWHLAHPVNATRHPHRQGELFRHTHRQFLARYNAERLSNGLHRTVHMKSLGPGEILHDPYHSHLADVASGKYWTPRHPKRLLRDIRHIHDPDIIQNIMLKDALTIYDRLTRSAQTGIMISRKGLTSIKNSKGIEPLAHTAEATELSLNPNIYNAFGLHNMGHLITGLVEDPDWIFKKTPGVMAEVATSMRDPLFYNYHHYIDNIFEKHKQSLSPYKVSGGDFPLLWRGIKILDVAVVSKKGPLNQLRTFWAKKKFELAPSVDGSTDKEDEHAKICAVHLAHEPFTFKIKIERQPCAKSKSGKGTIRIFIAPRFDEKGRRIQIREQRRLMIQMDAFQAKLRVGTNIVTRRSHDSSLTQPWTKHLHEYEHDHASDAAEFCGCGWPQHLYIPKGNHKGMPFDLFVMVTNFDEDYVADDPQDLAVPEPCNSPYILCGHPRRKYPDARPMGYPFDRPTHSFIPCVPGHSFAAVVCKSFNLVVYKPIDFLEEFVAKAPNMKSIVFDIKHIDKLVKGYYRHH